jgi:hypothetical protein
VLIGEFAGTQIFRVDMEWCWRFREAGTKPTIRYQSSFDQCIGAN